MKTYLTLLAALLGACHAGSVLAKAEKFEVDGIAVILKHNPNTPVVAAKFFLRGGLPYYGTDHAGTELLLLRVATKGTRKYPKEELQSSLARTGTRIDVEAGHDFTTLSLTCLERHLSEAWGIFADVISSPTLAEEEVSLARERLLNDIRQAKDDPDTYLRQLADEFFYEGRPYAVQPIGTEETVGRLDRAALGSYHRKQVTKARSLVVIVGQVGRKTAEKLVRQGLGKLPAGDYREPQQQQRATAGSRTRLEQRALPTNYVRCYYHCPSLSDPDYPATNVALRILRERLFEEVRTKRNLSYAVSAGLATRRDNYGMLYVTAVAPDTTLTVMLHEVWRLQTEPIAAKDLHDHVKTLVTNYLMGEQSNFSQAEELGRYELVGGGYGNAERVVPRMLKVTPEDVQRVAGKYIRNLAFVMLGDPEKWKDPLTPAAVPGDAGKPN